MLHSWRKSKFAQYCVYHILPNIVYIIILHTLYAKLWFHFFKKHMKPSVKNIIAFLTDLHSKGYTSDQLYMAMSAVGVLSDISRVGKHPDLKRFFKGLFEMAPVLPTKGRKCLGRRMRFQFFQKKSTSK